MKNKKTLIEFIKFGIVGFINTVLSYLIYVILVKLNVWYILASIIGFIITVFISYMLNSKYVFKSKFNIKELLKVYSSYLISTALSTLLLYFEVDIFNINKLLAPIINLFITVPINFLLNKYWAFDKNDKEKTERKDTMIKKIKSNFKEIIFDKKYYLPIILVSLLSYGYLLTHSTVNIDTLSYDRYFSGGELIAQGRLFAPLLEKIFHIYGFYPFFLDFLAVILFVIAATLMCSFFKTLSKNKINNICYTIFTCIFVSFPLIPEIFTYTPAGFNLGLGFILTTMSFILAYNCFKEKSYFKMILSFTPLMCSISLYESFASVFLVLFFITLILDNYYNKKDNYKELFRKCMLIIPLFIATLINIFLPKLIMNIFHIQASDNAFKAIYYEFMPFLDVIKHLFCSLYDKFILKGIYYYPILVFDIALFLGLITMILNIINKKNKKFILLYIGLLISTISLSFIQGTCQPYRTCQAMYLFVSFIFMIFINELYEMKIKDITKKIILIVIGIIIFYQCFDMYKVFYYNDLRYQSEKNIMIDVANDLNHNYDTNKKLVITGSSSLVNKVNSKMVIKDTRKKAKIFNYLSFYNYFELRKGETNVQNYINWGINAFGENGSELKKWWELLGYEFEFASVEEKVEILKDYKIKNHYPKKGYIEELDDYIIVVF